MTKNVLMLLLAIAPATVAVASEKPVLAALNAEALAMQTNLSAWTALNSNADEIFRKNEAGFAGAERGRKPADLRPAKFPLAFLVWRFENQQTKRNYDGEYLEAIAASPDLRRIDALLQLRTAQDGSWYDPWGLYLSEAATPEWAFQQIRAAIVTNATISTFALPYSLVFDLLGRFGEELPTSLRAPAYDLVRRSWPKGPSNGDGETFFDVLLRIDRERARGDLISYYGRPESPRWPDDRSYNLYVVELLDKYKGPSPAVAVAARKWLIDSRFDEWDVKMLERLILFSDPEHEVKPTLEKIKGLLRTQKEPHDLDELDTLVKAVLELGLPETADDLANFAVQPTVPILTRFQIVNWLVQRRHPALPEIFAWWLRSDSMDSAWIQNEAEGKGSDKKWGDYGKQLLAAGKKINQGRDAK